MAMHTGDWPTDDVLENGTAILDKIDALMEQNKTHPNYQGALNRWNCAADAVGVGNLKAAQRNYEAVVTLFS